MPPRGALSDQIFRLLRFRAKCRRRRSPRALDAASPAAPAHAPGAHTQPRDAALGRARRPPVHRSVCASPPAAGLSEEAIAASIAASLTTSIAASFATTLATVIASSIAAFITAALAARHIFASIIPSSIAAAPLATISPHTRTPLLARRRSRCSGCGGCVRLAAAAAARLRASSPAAAAAAAAAAACPLLALASSV